MDTLEVLIARVVDGDRVAFRSLYDATSVKLLRVILTIVFDRREAEEVLQESFVKIWLKAANFDQVRGRPMTWLCTIARNRAIDHRRRRPVTISVGIDQMHNISDPSPSADVLAFAAREARRLPAALSKLPPRASAAIRDTYFEGLRYEEISARDNIPVGTIKSWVRRGLQQMRADLTVETYANVGQA
ncbi:sigma-70 family RNA polymerase sigma factor (plasmid) [Polymorphobacter sp. PAMC 29334]|uniref:sigma-70 family RNA polymerase sigma factor n=1 Tax=Polymorphobacter sp. PAMC 29334 TaxID=2862331 RepID=UPI001C7958C2|nr:sigma-70 family RNA polymerase sigma factor [Polymorphobacter sp. PAMC 29334]QYE33350.1 sigma-70 family RNA polymerase sigma factor [Polymorphobacter sp. PAMC 29334]